MTSCPPPVRESDEEVCRQCRMRWDASEDRPACPEITSDEPDLTTRATLEAVAAGYHDLLALQAKQRKTMATLLKLCIMRIENPDSRKRREGIAGLRDLMTMLEKQA